jgi:hypothetical protein
VNKLSNEKINELINSYLKIDPKCVICRTPILGKNVNIAYLNGKSYSDIIIEFSDQFSKVTGRAGINKKQLVKHFNEHFNIKGLNLAEYMAIRDSDIDDSDEKDSGELQNELELLLNSANIGDLELIDAAVKEQIQQLIQLKNIAIEMKAQNRTFNLDKLIMKQQKIAKEIGTLATKKMALLSRTNLEQSQSDYFRGLTFLTSKLSSNIDLSQLNIKLEEIYLRIAVILFINKANDAITIALPNIPRSDHIAFLTNLKNTVFGLSKEVDAEFRVQIESMAESIKKASSGNKKLTFDQFNNITRSVEDAEYEELINGD